MNKKQITVYAVSLIAIFLVTGCGKKYTKHKLSSGPIAKKAPLWVNQGSGAFKDADNKKVFYGLGMISGIKNRALAIQAADQRARAEIAKALDNYVAVLSRDYMTSTSAVQMQQAAEEQDISVALKGFSRFTLKGAVIMDHWYDEDSDTMFSLARLEADNLNKSIEQSQEADDKLRNFVRSNSDRAFDELAEAESVI